MLTNMFEVKNKDKTSIIVATMLNITYTKEEELLNRLGIKEDTILITDLTTGESHINKDDWKDEGMKLVHYYLEEIVYFEDKDCYSLLDVELIERTINRIENRGN